MDEKPRIWSKLLMVLWVPPALALMLLATLLLGLAVYIRAMAGAVTALFASLLGRKTPSEGTSLQPPHFLDSPLSVRNSNSAALQSPGLPEPRPSGGGSPGLSEP